MPHTLVVQFHQLFRRFHAVVLRIMVEPSRTDGDIAFGTHPLVAIGVTVLQGLEVGIARIYLLTADEGPVGSTGNAPFVAHPTAARSSVGEDDGLWLVVQDMSKDIREVVVVPPVDFPGFTGTPVVAVTTVGSIEPELEQRAIFGSQLLQLLVIILHILRCAIGSLVTVPGREVEAQFQSILPASLTEFSHDIAFTILIRCVPDTVLREFRRPEAETIVMLGSEDYACHASLLERTDPLFRVAQGRVKDTRLGISVAPFPVGVGVQSEMDERIGFQLMPLHLVGCRDRTDGLGFRHGTACTSRKCHQCG